MYLYRPSKETVKMPEPEFKNPRIGQLFDQWRGVWLMSMQRQQKLQDALDRLNEVTIWLIYSFIFL